MRKDMRNEINTKSRHFTLKVVFFPLLPPDLMKFSHFYMFTQLQSRFFEIIRLLFMGYWYLLVEGMFYLSLQLKYCVCRWALEDFWDQFWRDEDGK